MKNVTHAPMIWDDESGRHYVRILSHWYGWDDTVSGWIRVDASVDKALERTYQKDRKATKSK